MRKNEEEEEEEEKEKEEGEEEKEDEFFVEKNPARVLLTPRVPLWEIFLQKKSKRMSRK
jgi:hypothetical protein